MLLSANDITLQVIAITAVFLAAAAFLLLYINLYNNRKKKHLDEKMNMQRVFNQELDKTRLEVQQQTLQTIASDIHDNVGQILSLTRVSLSTVKIEDEPQKAAEKIENALGLLDTSIKELRQLAAILHADHLLKSGLQQAIENELDRLHKTGVYETSFRVHAEVLPKQDPRKELIIFRVIQELLNNSIKHAAASVISIDMNAEAGALHITVKDNGKGFNVQKALQESSGMGLGNILRRMKMIEGEILLQSESGRGTTAMIVLPGVSNNYY